MGKNSRRKASKFEKIMTNLLMSSDDEEDDDIDMSIKNSTISPSKDDFNKESDYSAVGTTSVQLLISFTSMCLFAFHLQFYNHCHKVLK